MTHKTKTVSKQKKRDEKQEGVVMSITFYNQHNLEQTNWKIRRTNQLIIVDHSLLINYQVYKHHDLSFYKFQLIDKYQNKNP